VVGKQPWGKPLGGELQRPGGKKLLGHIDCWRQKKRAGGVMKDGGSGRGKGGFGVGGMRALERSHPELGQKEPKDRTAEPEQPPPKLHVCRGGNKVIVQTSAQRK